MKSKTLKKCSTAVSLMLVLGLLTACGAPAEESQNSSSEVAESSSAAVESSEASESESSEPVEYEYEEVTITVSGSQGATDDWNKTEFVQGMKDKFGVTMDCQPYADDAWATKLSLMFAEDDLPDLIIRLNLGLADVADYGSQGYFLPINEYLDHMPNLAAFFEEHPDYKMYCTSPDGNIYCLLPYNLDWLSNGLPRNFIKTSWLENVGMENPTTIDELYDVLVAFRDQDANGNGDPNDEIPMIWAGSYVRTIEHSILPAYGIFPAGATAATRMIMQTDENGQVYMADTTEEYKAYLTFMNKCWEEGLIYNESYSIDITAQRELTKEDRVGFYADASSYIAAGNGDTKDSQYYEHVIALTSEYNETSTFALSSSAESLARIAVSAGTEHPEEICRMLDYLYTEEGIVFSGAGYVENYATYESVGIEGYEDYCTWIYPEEVPAGYDGWELHRYQVRTINKGPDLVTTMSGAVQAIAEGPQDEDMLFRFAEEGISGWVAMLKIRMNEANTQVINGYPALVYDEDISEERSSLAKDLSLYLETAKSQFITGEVDIEEGWDEYIATLEQIGLERFLEIEQQAYDKLVKN